MLPEYIEYELNVPSGVMVYDVHIQEFQVQDHLDITVREGMKRHVATMADHGCAFGHFFRCTASLVLNKVDADRFEVVNPFFDDETGELVERNSKYVETILGNSFMFADKDEYLRRSDILTDVYTLEVTPGVYRFQQRLDPIPESPTAETLLARIEWVRDPDPVRNFYAEYLKRNLTAEQVIADKIRFDPDFYRRPYGIMHAARDIFIGPGSRRDWHPNGFIDLDIHTPTDSVDLVIPQFDEVYHWHPPFYLLDCGLARAAYGVMRLNQSFAILAINVVACIAKHGDAEYPENQKIANEWLKRLVKRYPEAARVQSGLPIYVPGHGYERRAPEVQRKDEARTEWQKLFFEKYMPGVDDGTLTKEEGKKMGERLDELRKIWDSEEEE